MSIGSHVIYQPIPSSIALGERSGREATWRDLIAGQADKVPAGDPNELVTIICGVVALNTRNTNNDMVIINATQGAIVGFCTNAEALVSIANG